MNNGNYNTTSDEVSFSKILKRSSELWYVFAASLILFVALFYFLLKVFVPIYDVSSKILIKQNSNSVNPNQLFLGEIISNNPTDLSNETSIIKSFPLVHASLKELGFDLEVYRRIKGIKYGEVYKNNNPFIISYDRNGLVPYNVEFDIKVLNFNEYQLSATFSDENESSVSWNEILPFGEEANLQGFNFKIDLNKWVNAQSMDEVSSTKYHFIIKNLEDLVYAYKGALKINPLDKKSSILILEMQSKTPRKAITFLDHHLKRYINSSLMEKNQIADNTLKFINKEITTLEDSLSIIERNLESFKSSKNITNISTQAGTILEQMGELDRMIAQTKLEIKYYKYIKENLVVKSDYSELVSPTAFGVSDPVLTELIMRLITAQSEKNLIQTQGLTKSPSLNRLNEEISSLSRNIQESVYSLDISKGIMLKDMNERFNRLQASTQNLNQSERELVNIQRLFSLKESIYLILMEKRAEVAISKSGNVPDAKIVEPAILTSKRPTFPNSTIFYGLGIILGLMVPLFIILIYDLLNVRLKDKEELEALTDMPILGMIPTHSTEDYMVVKTKPKSGIAESFRLLRSNIDFFVNNSKSRGKFILLTSSISQEGKTFCSLNLAVVFSISNKKTIVLGMDLRKPKLQKYIDISPTVGLSNYLSGNVDNMEDIIYQTSLNNLYFISSGPVPPNPSELLMQERMDILMNHLRENFDIIIMDTPPYAVVTDAYILKKYSDLNIFVTRQGYTPKEFVKQLDESYKEKKFKNSCLVLNDVKKDSKFYGYGYYLDNEESQPFWKKFLKFKK